MTLHGGPINVLSFPAREVVPQRAAAADGAWDGRPSWALSASFIFITVGSQDPAGGPCGGLPLAVFLLTLGNVEEPRALG